MLNTVYKKVFTENKFFLKFILCLMMSSSARAAEAAKATDTDTLPDIVVSGRGDDLLGIADSATQGTVGSQELETRPLARPGEVLETVPGMIITQHSGAGKANQYYLRGFNLDHGTDFATYVDGVPVNLPTHAHGQGYTDLNFLIPELVQGVTYEKGVYYADQGDFANAGAAEISYVNTLPTSHMAIAEVGTLGFERVLMAGSTEFGNGHLLYALEVQHYDGNWDVANDYRKINGVLKYSDGDEKNGRSLALEIYSGIWLANDQVPERAIDEGLIDRYGSLDPSVGGSSYRYSLNGEWHKQDDDSATKVVVYGVGYGLDLYSDFTYFLNQTQGDEIEQYEHRIYGGVRAKHTIYGKFLDHDTENTFGFQARDDEVDPELNQVTDRVVWQHDRTDHVSELNIAPWYENKIHWSSWFRSVAGVRYDDFNYSDRSDLAGDSGQGNKGALSPKLSLIFGPWSKTELYLQGGYGIRSNDVRGVLSKVGAPTATDPMTTPSLTQNPIVRTKGAEVGVRSSTIGNLTTTLSCWYLWSESDTFFDGDIGAVVDANRPGQRYGVEWTNFYTPLPWLVIDADFADSRAYYTDHNPVGDYIPEAITTMISAGITVKDLSILPGSFASLRWREFGPRPLIEDNSQQSQASSVFNFITGYNINRTWTASFEILNVFNAHYNDAEYYYGSRLKGEAIGNDIEGDGGTDDHMVHAGEPQSFRLAVGAKF